jgi:hypothetical protein
MAMHIVFSCTNIECSPIGKPTSGALKDFSEIKFQANPRFFGAHFDGNLDIRLDDKILSNKKLKTSLTEWARGFGELIALFDTGKKHHVITIDPVSEHQLVFKRESDDTLLLTQKPTTYPFSDQFTEFAIPYEPLKHAIHSFQDELLAQCEAQGMSQAALEEYRKIISPASKELYR